MYLQGAAVALGACGLGMLAAWLWQRRIGRRWIADGGPTVSAACGAIASMYVLTIAFLIVSTSNSLGTARAGTGIEAGAVRDAYLASRGYPAAQAAALQRGLRDYARTVVDEEWPLMARGQAAPAAWEHLDALRDLTTADSAGASGAAGAAAPGASAQSQSDLHDALQQVYTQRRARLSAAAGDGISPVLLGFLITSACVAPFFLLLMGWPTGPRALLGMGLLAAMFASGVWVVVQLNHPFASGIRVGSGAFRDALARMDQLDARPVGPAGPPGPALGGSR
ncbi:MULTISPECIES: DUF4239 domain-containing protein [Kitasatospora]|uniref:DUF4239 domain-containing protein n=1 Tax=Kitasatospora setae (strain ATCC 33774 / DSM 43861 / JCM 3304 / KCC A-0304 / NBRC 14216 / KM-6054) TaxID=452652 RepID=E4N3H1_KITSK|nr:MULTISPECIES: DUF4239 domain-containing protein [Kitasatospora]BAJ32705.1 hypothetical protein KSE_69470 [Kitasatospora setae KM-6054]